ncbi:hypothetical protein [Clostridium botulinum]|uniref:hypothetical protein n=1 Tax=Clostridium botulinum TaxID=1491 RepID=UPI001C9A3AD5|nr:hypothetical protein [Clostridium botulinum]MBY6838835.1 hypothetical protein [Clostridium botulinum]
MENKITLVRKQPTPFEVNYPLSLPNGQLTHFDWTGTKGNIVSKRDVPVEVFQWLKDSTTTFKDGCLIVDDNIEQELDGDSQYLINSVKDEQSEIKKAIKTRVEIEEMLSTGNQNVLKKALNDLTKDVEDEEQIKEIKNYIYRTAIDIGVDSNAKRKVICDWYGTDVENCGFIFDEEK